MAYLSHILDVYFLAFAHPPPTPVHSKISMMTVNILRGFCCCRRASLPLDVSVCSALCRAHVDTVYPFLWGLSLHCLQCWCQSIQSVCTSLSLPVFCKLPAYFKASPGMESKQLLSRVGVCTPLAGCQDAPVLCPLFCSHIMALETCQRPPLYPGLPRKPLVTCLGYLFNQLFLVHSYMPNLGCCVLSLHHARRKRGGKIMTALQQLWNYWNICVTGSYVKHGLLQRTRIVLKGGCGGGWRGQADTTHPVMGLWCGWWGSQGMLRLGWGGIWWRQALAVLPVLVPTGTQPHLLWRNGGH